MKTWASSSIPWQNYWAWLGGKIKVFWFFRQVEDLGGHGTTEILKKATRQVPRNIRSLTSRSICFHCKSFPNTTP
jgi:hypothetical protein